MLSVAGVAILAAVLSVAVKVIGMPAQLRQNYVRKSTEGLSNWFLVLTLVSYAMWVIHGLQVHDSSLVIGQGLGVFATLLILYQVVIYRKKTRSHRSKPIVLWYAAMQTMVRSIRGKNG